MTQHNGTIDTIEPTERNTMRARCWGPNTWNNYSQIDLEVLTEFCNENCEDYRINPEVGKEGTPHLQFCFKFKNARTFNSLKKTFPNIHIEKSRNWNATVAYCEKSETSVGECIKKEDNPYSHVNDDEFVNKSLELYWWQTQIIELYESEPNNRTIDWYWEPTGNVGKTSFVRHLVLTYPKKILFVSGKSADIKYAMINAITKGHDIRMVIFHCVRTLENFISYEAIESIKDGIFFSGKYEAGMCVFNRPHCVCIANFEPEFTAMSGDRWNIIQIE